MNAGVDPGFRFGLYLLVLVTPRDPTVWFQRQLTIFVAQFEVSPQSMQVSTSMLIHTAQASCNPVPCLGNFSGQFSGSIGIRTHDAFGRGVPQRQVRPGRELRFKDQGMFWVQFTLDAEADLRTDFVCWCLSVV